MRIIALLLLAVTTVVNAQPAKLVAKSEKLAKEVESKVIEWRHDIHQNPELSNREFKTAEKIAAHLESLGIEVQTGVAHTGVVGVLKGGKPGPVVGLRADMDALPVTERVDIPWASKVKSTYNNIETGVMHACGHDTHVAMLMGAARILTEIKDELQGTIVFVFQPAEEGAPPGEEGGAKLMVKEGVLKNPDVDVIFGLHISSNTPVGQIKYRPRGTMAAADRFVIKVKGKQTHGSSPWSGVDPIVASAQIINGLQTIISRQSNLTEEAAVITVGMMKAGTRNNIIPEEAELIGTIRTLDTAMQSKIHRKIELTATKIAESMGAKAEVDIQIGTPVTFNDPELTKKMIPTLHGVVGKENLMMVKPITGAEDFAFYAREIPGLFLFVGGMPKDQDPSEAAPHHTPDFYIDESGMKLGVRTLCNLAIDYMAMNPK